MPLSLDPEFAAAIGPLMESMAARPKFPAGDVENRRKAAGEGLLAMIAAAPHWPNVVQEKHSFQSADGTTLAITEFYNSAAPKPEKAVYYIHGGGMIMGSVESFGKLLERKVSEWGIRIFAVSYRLAPEVRHPKPLEDCYAGLEWLSKNAARLGLDSKKIVLHGESAGGGLAAAVALYARDKGFSPPIAKQILIFPMLDDRNNTPLPHIAPFAGWSCNDNITGWGALLGAAAGGPDVSPYAAPARATDLSNLPSTYIDCGDLDIFLYEDVDYAARLMRAGVQVELHIYPGVPHGFQMVTQTASVAKNAVENVRRAIERV